MLDQSFSAKNYEIIFNLANRKGLIKLSEMPIDYQNVVERLKDLKKRISEIKKKKRIDWTSDDVKNYNLLTTQINEVQEQKQECLYEYLADIADKTSVHYKLELSKHEDPDSGKDVYQVIDDGSKKAFYAIKQLQYNIQKTFKVQQANRHAILTNIKVLLNSKLSLYIIRTDISGFYESIPQKQLIECLTNNSLLSARSISYVKGIIREYNITLGQLGNTTGIPRGVAISPLLSEIYMRDIDSQIRDRQEVIYYARYVDDIFIILTSLNGQNLDDYYTGIRQLFTDNGLNLHDVGDKCKLIDLYNESKNITESLTYLGYTLSIEKKGRDIVTTFSLSDNKKQKIRNRIDNVFSYFEEQSRYNVKLARDFLFNGLKYIAGNNRLKGAKSRIKIGIYYNNDLLDKVDELDEFTNYLYAKVVNPSQIKFKTDGERNNYIRHIKKAIQKINFKENWTNKKMYSLSSETIKEIQHRL